MAVIEVIGDKSNLTAGNSASIDREYAITGVQTAEAAVLALRNYLLLTIGNPPSIGSLVLDEISDAEQVENVYYATARWRTFERRARPAVGESQFNFDAGVEAVKVNAAIGGITSYKASGEEDWSPEHINDQGDGSDVDGVEIYEPVYEESETHWIETSSLTQEYRDTLSQIVGCVNDAPFKGWQAGEVLMRPISGTRRGASDSEITFRWAVRRNQDNITLGNITGISKQGWQYLWPRFRVTRASNAPSRKVISHVAVATVFRTADFSGLGIGT